jgi:hypothetical protein
MNPQVLINGCNVVNGHNGRWAVADLHEVAGAFVFVCNTNGVGEVDWHNVYPRHSDKVVHLINDWLDRRGIIVVDAEDCELNDAAKAHIRKWTPGLSPDWGADK